MNDKDIGYIDRLAKYWPEPRDQLHFGGWKATYAMEKMLKIDNSKKILDICCGEGGTTIYLAKKYQIKVYGIDFDKKAIQTARDRAEKEGLAHLTDFRIGDIHKLPYKDSMFDIIMGLDADGFANSDRVEIFKECRRVLKPNGVLGFQLWLPWKDVPAEVVNKYEEINHNMGFPGMKRLSFDLVIKDLEKAGFKITSTEDLSEMYAAHMYKMEENLKTKDIEPGMFDKALIEDFKKGLKFGVRIMAEAKKKKTEIANAKPLPKANLLYFYGHGLFDTELIFDFDTIKEENEYSETITTYLKKNSPEFKWTTQKRLVAGTVDNYSPPKTSAFISGDLNDLIEKKDYVVRINDNKKIIIEIAEITVDIYRFNCGIIHFIVNIPEEEWQNLETLTRIRFLIQKHKHDITEFGIDMETIFSPIIKKIKNLLNDVRVDLNPPLLKTPFLDFTTISDEIKTMLNWTHSTLVAIMPEDFDVNGEHFQSTLLDLNPDGIQNYALVPNVFAYVESGDSLICLRDIKDVQERNPKQIAKQDWIAWLALHNYTWKTVWQLERGLHVILNLVVSHLKHKRTKKFRDVYAVNALINHLVLVLDQHKPRNLTTTYYSIHFLEKISESWRTGEILEAANVKMESLRDLISQIDELDEKMRGKRTEIFLNLLGVFTLGSLVLDFIQAMSFADIMPDWEKWVLGLGIPTIFIYIGYKLTRD